MNKLVSTISKNITAILLLSLIATLVFAAQVSAENIKGEVIVLFKPKTSFSATQNAIDKVDGRAIKNLKINNKRIRVVGVKQGSERQVIKNLAGDSRVEVAEQIPKIKAAWTPNDPLYALGTLNYVQWNLNRISMAGAWDVSRGSGATVAVLDTGIARGLQDINYSNILKGYDFVNRDSDPVDDDGHGTHVTSIIAAKTDNNVGIAGIAPSADILPIKVLDSNGEGSGANLLDGLIYAYKKGADVVNMSFDLDSSSSVLKSVLDDIARDGVVLVSASGNSGAGSVSYPAKYGSVMAVGATNYSNSRASYSNYGKGLLIMAPGGDLDLDQNSDSYGDGILAESIAGLEAISSEYYFFDGTSVATAQVSGVAALLYSQGVRGFRHFDEAISRSATDLGSGGYDTTYGHGLINASAALNITKSNLSAHVSPTRIRYGQRVKVFGTIIPQSRKTIYIQAYDDKTGIWKTIGKTASQTNGRYRYKTKIARNSYIRADWKGSSSILGQTSTEKRVLVKPIISVKGSARRIRKGSRVVLSGSVKPAGRGKILYIQEKVGRRWRTVARTRLSRRSTYKKPVRLNSRKNYILRVLYKSDGHHISTASNRVSIRAY